MKMPRGVSHDDGSAHKFSVNGENLPVMAKFKKNDIKYTALIPGKSDYTLSCWGRLKKGDKGGALFVKHSGYNWVSLGIDRKEIRYEMGRNPANYAAFVLPGKVKEEE